MILTMLSSRMCILFRKKSQDESSRGMATLKAISVRLKSVKNIQKITQSMKMVSAAKFTRAERELKSARPFGEQNNRFYENADIKPESETEEKPSAKKILYIAMTSDRGLCGATHSSVAKYIRQSIREPGENIKIVCVGDKSRALLRRTFSDNILLVCNEIGRVPPTFIDASKIAEEIFKSQFEYDLGKIIYNRFKSVVSYGTEEINFYSIETVKNSLKVQNLEGADDETILAFIEFSITSFIYYAMKQGACSEQSSRMTAMDNASKNAKDMISELTLTFNRTRQAVITRELIEIISGASAL